MNIDIHIYNSLVYYCYILRTVSEIDILLVLKPTHTKLCFSSESPIN